MNVFLKACRHLHPKLYIRTQMARIERESHELQPKLWAGMQTAEQRDIERKLQDDRREFYEWRLEIEDKELVKKAAKIGVYLDEIVFPDTEDDRNFGRYHRIGEFGNELIRDEFRRPLKKAVHERETVYRKERREQVDFYIKSITTIITAIVGLIGAVIGLLAIIRK